MGRQIFKQRAAAYFGYSMEKIGMEQDWRQETS